MMTKAWVPAKNKLMAPWMITIYHGDSVSTNAMQNFHQKSTDFMLTITFKKSCKLDHSRCSIEAHYSSWLYRSLSNILFLKENEYSEQQTNHFELANLEALCNTIVDESVDQSVRFDTNLCNQISAVLRVSLGEGLVSVYYSTVDNIFLGFPSQDSTWVMKEKINKTAESANDDDYQLIAIIINS